ncbi:SdrD B-like domain-containing protein [Verrucomicrobiaceae bacterium 227]
MRAFKAAFLTVCLTTLSSVTVSAKDTITDVNNAQPILTGPNETPPFSIGDFNVRGPYEIIDGPNAGTSLPWVDLFLGSSHKAEWWVNGQQAAPWSGAATANNYFAYHSMESIPAGGSFFAAWSFGYGYYDYTSSFRHNGAQIPDGSIVSFGLSNAGNPVVGDWHESADSAFSTTNVPGGINLSTYAGPSAAAFSSTAAFEWRNYEKTGGTGADLKWELSKPTDPTNGNALLPMTDYVVFVQLPPGVSLTASGDSFVDLDDDDFEGLGVTDEIVFNWTIDSKDDTIGEKNPQFGHNLGGSDPCELEFTDGAGGAPLYQVGDFVHLEVTDEEANANDAAPDTLIATLENDRTGETEVVTLTETGNDTNIFKTSVGGFPTTSSGSTANNDGTLNVQPGDTMTGTVSTGGTGAQCVHSYRFPVPAELVKAVDKSNSSPGETLTYTVNPRYPMGDVLTNVVVTDAAPAETTLIGSSANAGGIEAGSNVTWNLGSTAAGDSHIEFPGLMPFSALDHVTDSFGNKDSITSDLAIDSNGFQHVVFQGEASKKNIYYTNNTSGSWSVPLLISSNSEDGLNPAIGVDSSGNAHIIYTEKSGKVNAYYKKVTSGTAGTRILLSSNNEDVSNPDIAVSGSNVHVVFDEKQSGNSKINIYHRVSTNGGTSFGSVTRISVDGDNDALDPSVAASGATAHIVYTDKIKNVDSKRNVYHVAGTAGSFGTPTRLSSDNEDALSPEVTLDGSGNALVVFVDKKSGDDKKNIYFSTNSGGSFSTPINVSEDYGNEDSSNPVISVDTRGDAHIAFQNIGTDGGNIDIIYVNNMGGLFGSPEQITTDFGGNDSTTPAIAADSNSVCLVFDVRGPSDGKVNIYNTCADINVGTRISVSTNPGIGVTGDTVTVTAILEATENLTGVLPVITPPVLTNGMGLSLVSSPSAQNLTVDTPASFVWTYTITEAGSATPATLGFSVAATLNDPTYGPVDFGTATSNSFIATPPLTFQVTVNPGAVGPILNTASISDTTGFIPPTASNEVETTIGYAIGDFVWVDTNGNGVQDGGETGLDGVIVNLLNPDGSPTGRTTTTATKSGNPGYYEFAYVIPGNYLVEFVKPAGYVFSPQDIATGGATDATDSDADPATGRAAVTVSGANNPTTDAGVYQPVSVAGKVEFDNVLGAQPLGGVTLRLLDGNGDPVDDPNQSGTQDYVVTSLGLDGSYSFVGLPPGTYRVAEDQPAGYSSISDTDNANNNLIGDQTPITLTSGQSSTGNNFLEALLVGSIGDYVWNDADGDGVQDANEVAIPGVVVFIDLNSDGIKSVGEPSATTDGSGAYLIGGLIAGIYNVTVDGTTLPAGMSNTGDPDATKDGKSSVTLAIEENRTDVDFGYQSNTSLGDYVWIDADGDGVQDGGETPLQGVTVFVDLNNDGIRDANEPSVTTDSNGAYRINGLIPGTYSVVLDPATIPAGATVTGDPDATKDGKASVTLAAGDDIDTIDFGLQGNASLGDYVWNDANGDGVQDANELPISGVTVFIDLNNDGVKDANELSATTDSNGAYLIGGLTAGTYEVTVDGTTLPAGVTVTGDPDATKNGKTTVVLASGQNFATADFGYQGNASIGDYVWNDADGDGVQDADELPLPGVVVFIDLNNDGVKDANEPSATTDGNGGYSIDGLMPGTYAVDIDDSTLPAGVTVTGDPDATKDGKASVTLAAGDALDTVDFGLQGNASLGDYVWNDSNGDGVQDVGELPLSGVKVFLDLDNDGTYDANEPSATTDGNGAYLIGGLVPGTYTIDLVDSTVPAGVTVTGDPDAVLDGKTSVTLAAGDALDTVDFGLQGNASIGDYVWNDANGDGVQDADELPLSGVKVFLDLDNDGILDANEAFATTSGAGAYLIDGLTPGTYTVTVDDSTLPAGVSQTGDPDSVVNNKTTVILAAGQNFATADFGYQGNTSIGDYVWNDFNGDGNQEAGETPLPGVTVFVDLNNDGIFDANEPSATTNGSGAYSIVGLVPGSYTVSLASASIPVGATVTGDPDATLDGKTPVVLAAGDNIETVDFGLQGNTSIGDYVWVDADGDGVQDPDEAPLAGVQIFVDINSDGTKDPGEPSATTDGNGAYTISGLAAGTYDVVLDQTTLPAGVTITGDPDGTFDGKTSVTVAANESIVTIDFGVRGNASIGDYVWNDADGDGVQDPNESPLGGVTVFLDLDNDGIKDANEPSATTDSNGAYTLAGLVPGSYGVALDPGTLPAGASVTGDPDATKDGKASVTLAAGDDIDTIDFGLRGDASIGDYVWNDANGDGVQDADELPLPGVLVFLDLNNDGIKDANELSATTDSNGAYLIGGLTAGTYEVTVDGTTLPAGVTNTGDPDATKNGKTTVVLASGQNFTTADFGYQGNASIGDYVWNDADGDGVQDADEFPLPGVVVFIDLNNDGVKDANEPSATTDGNGGYSIDGLMPGTYAVDIDDSTLPAGVTVTGDPDATKDGKASVTLAAGDALDTVDFGLQGNASLGDYVWNDSNGDGVQDVGELPLSGVKVFLDLDNDGTYDANEPSATTDGNGAYLIGGLVPGTYTIDLVDSTVPAGVTVTGDPDAILDGKTSVTLAAGDALDTVDFGLQGNASIGDYVWNDANGDGVQDADELPLSGVKVFLDLDNDGILDANEAFATTSGAGAYLIDGLTPGTYTVTVDDSTLPAGVSQTGDPDSVVNNKTTVMLAAGQNFATADFGYQGNTSIGDYVWNDFNGDGNQEAGETPLPGVTVFVDLNNDGIFDANEPSATTNGSGAYSIVGLVPGSYTVSLASASIPVGATVTGDPDATLDGKTPVVLAAGDNIETVDFGLQGNTSIGDYVWVDADGDGVQDPDEAPLAGVQIFVDINSDGTKDPGEPSATTDGNGAYTISGLAAGTYDVVLDQTTLPAGVTITGDPDGTFDGKTSVTVAANESIVTIDFGVRGNASIGDYVWNDADGDGVQDPNESPLGGVTVFLDLDNDGIKDANEPSATTDSNGAYTLAGLVPGSYGVALDPGTLPAGASVTGDPDATKDGKASVTLAAGDDIDTIDFGLRGDASIGDYVWNDANGDGVQDADELPLPGVLVFLDLNNDGIKDANELSATTDSNGAYLIGGLTAGTYEVTVDGTTLPAGVTNTGDPDATKNGKTTVVLASGQNFATADFGYQGNASIGDYVWNDADGDGVQDADELPLPGVVVFIDLNNDGVKDANEPSATTDANGNYTIAGLVPGTYSIDLVDVTIPAEVTVTGDPDATKDGKTSVTLAAGDIIDTVDFGLQGNASLGDYVWNDYNGDGVQDPGEAPLSGVTLFLDLDNDGVKDANEPSATTDGNGAYLIDGLTAGTYEVMVDGTTLPAGVTNTGDPDATKDGKTTVTLAAGQNLDTVDFGYQSTATVSGNVFEDSNGLDDGTVNGIGTNAGGLHVSLVDPVNDTVIACIPVNPDGSYFFGPGDRVEAYMECLLILTPAEVEDGTILTESTLPNSRESTGEHLGADAGDDGTPDGILAITTTDGNLVEANFGINILLPDVTPVITAQPNVMNGPTDFNIRVQVVELDNVDTDGTITVRIPKDARWKLRKAYEPTLTLLDGVTMNNSVWNFSENATHYVFTTVNPLVVIPGSGYSYFGIKARWETANQQGVYTVTSQIDAGSGNETRIDNNSDAERIDFFDN